MYGQKGLDEQKGEDRKYFINGLFNIVDGAFLSGFFLSELPGTNIVIGPYPLNANDVELIAKTGVKAILNLQTPIEEKLRGVDK